jgi:hypothetical protein
MWQGMISDDKYLHEKFKHFASLSLNKQRIIYIHILLKFGQIILQMVIGAVQ